MFDVPPLSPHPLEQPWQQAIDRQAFLFHRIAVADGDGVFDFITTLAERFEVDRDAEWRADFILAAIAATDGSGVVVGDIHP